MKEETKVKVDRCCECSYYKELKYSEEENLWLCVNCEVNEG